MLGYNQIMSRSKAGIIRDTSRKTGIPRADAEALIDIFLDEITKTVLAGDKVIIPGFGTFQAGMKATGTVKGPNGKHVPYEGKGVFQFTPARRLQAEIGQLSTTIDPVL